MSSRLTKTFSVGSVEAHVASDCWLYGHTFVVERKPYKITNYCLSGDRELSVIVILEAQLESPAAAP